MKAILSWAAIFCVLSANAQQWGGSSTTTGLISRNGNITVGNSPLQAFNTDTGSRYIQLVGSNNNYIDMVSSAYPGSMLIGQGNGFASILSTFPISFSIYGGPKGTFYQAVTVETNGNLVLGNNGNQTNSGYVLDVYGPARANQVVVNTTGADFVFDSTYRLPSLAYVEGYIRRRHHLPGISPATTMQEQGLDVGDNQMRLLQKIEELTLYTIDQQHRIDGLEARLSQLESLVKNKK